MDLTHLTLATADKLRMVETHQQSDTIILTLTYLCFSVIKILAPLPRGEWYFFYLRIG